MATIQAKVSRGHKYWYIVESRRVNGKPRPIVLAYLGKAEDLLRRLQGLTAGLKLKSYSHGAMAALLSAAQRLDIPAEINRHVHSPRTYMAEKPIRNNLTVGMTLLLGAIGRICMQTSKRGWWAWAKTTSCEYLLRCSLSRIDSQHFWDLMDALPIDAIPRIESVLVKRVLSQYAIQTDTLFFDTTNFFTYVATTNTRCTIAQRGKNKQHRYDLRQVGLALVVSREDFIPLFHLTYQGNFNDITVFKSVVESIKTRMEELHLDLQRHCLVFDRGNNSKKNLAMVTTTGLHYVGALSPSHHAALVDEALEHMNERVESARQEFLVFRDKRVIWDEERTVVAFVSDKLRAGQIRGLHQELAKAEKNLTDLQERLKNPCSYHFKAAVEAEERVLIALHTVNARQVFTFSVCQNTLGGWDLTYAKNLGKIDELQEEMGLRILMTDRHDWNTAAIIEAYHGQSFIENAFRNLKNPAHLALRPQYHWTDQKIAVHFFICVLGYLLATVVRREAIKKASFVGSMDALLDTLNNIRLATIIEESITPGPAKATHKLEVLDAEQ
ncbi:MAG: IS1634 family transposase, partial [Spirochaetaceae bacterium]